MDKEMSQEFQALFDNAGLSTRSYSGRSMYGKQCLAVELESGRMGEFIGNLCSAVACHDDPSHAAELVDDACRDMRTDSMGHGIVVYFPSVSYTATPDEDEDKHGDCSGEDCACSA